MPRTVLQCLVIEALLFLSEDQTDTILRDLGRWGGGKFYKLRRTF